MATANMALSLPIVGTTAGPTWASMLNTALTLVDAHDHSSGKGVQITPAGLNINTDLSINSNNINAVRSLRLFANTSAVNGISDIRNVYVLNDNLYYNNASGTAVQITSGSSINAAGIATNVFPTTTISANTTILNTDTFTYLLVNTAASRNITLPAASAVTAGRYYVVKDVAGFSDANPITIIRAGSDSIDGVSGNKTLSTPKGSWFIVSNGSNAWHLFSSITDSFTTLGVVTIGSGSNLIVGSGGAATIASGGTLTIAGSSYFPAYGSARTRTIQFMPALGLTFTGWGIGESAVASTANAGNGLFVAVPTHNGATLSSITMYYSISASKFPSIGLLKLKVRRTDNAANLLDLTSTGFQSVPGTNAATYYQGGAIVSATFTPDQNNIIDNTQYTYHLFVVDETGTGATTGNAIYGFQANYTNIVDQRFA